MSALEQRSATLKRAGNSEHLIRKRSARHLVRPISLMTTPQADLQVIQVHESWEEGPFQFLLLDTTTRSTRTITPQDSLSAQMNQLTKKVDRLSTSNKLLKQDVKTLTSENTQLKKDVKTLTTANAALTRSVEELTVSNAALVKEVDTFRRTLVEKLKVSHAALIKEVRDTVPRTTINAQAWQEIIPQQLALQTTYAQTPAREDNERPRRNPRRIRA